MLHKSVGTISDRSAWHEYERKLQQRNERLEQFASVVSHDLRSPLSVAQGRLELAREECDSDHLAAIERAHDRMDTLIENILTLAREGDTVADAEVLSIGELAEACWATVETDGATLTVEGGPTVRGDAARLKRLFENLFRNSVEHGSTSSRTQSDDAVEHGSTGSRASPDDAGEHGSTSSRASPDDAEHTESDVTVRVGAMEGGFFVEDDGPGIPEDNREAVFETGYSTGEDGTGFGLAIVERIVEAHGWTIEVTERPGGGARFEITGIDDVSDDADSSGAVG